MDIHPVASGFLVQDVAHLLEGFGLIDQRHQPLRLDACRRIGRGIEGQAGFACAAYAHGRVAHVGSRCRFGFEIELVAPVHLVAGKVGVAVLVHIAPHIGVGGGPG